MIEKNAQKLAQISAFLESPSVIRSRKVAVASMTRSGPNIIKIGGNGDALPGNAEAFFATNSY